MDRLAYRVNITAVDVPTHSVAMALVGVELSYFPHNIPVSAMVALIILKFFSMCAQLCFAYRSLFYWHGLTKHG